MRFDEFAREAGKAVVAAARRAERPPILKVQGRERRRTLAAMSSAVAVVVVLVGAVSFWPPDPDAAPMASESTTTTEAGPTSSLSGPTTTTTVAREGLDLSNALWVTHGDGIRLDDGTVIWATQPFPASVARDREGGLAFTDSTGLWWFQAGTVEPVLVGDVIDEVISVATTPSGPVALTRGAGSYRLTDGESVETPSDAPVEVLTEPPWLKWTAANGLSAWVTEPEVETDPEGQPSEILEPAHLIIADGGEVLVDTRVGDSDEAWATIHDFDGQRLIVSRGPYEPAMPEEAFLLIDLATGETTEMFVAGGTKATFTGADSDWSGPVQEPVPSN